MLRSQRSANRRKIYYVQKESANASGQVNEMIGNSLLRGVSQANVKQEDKQTKINFVFSPGAKKEDVIEIFEERIRHATENTNYALLLFQNDVRDLGKTWEDNDKNAMTDKVKDTFEKIRDIKIRFSGDLIHKVAIAEEQYPPELEEYIGLIWLVNELIREENLKNNMGMFKLWKAMMKSKPKNTVYNPGSLPRMVASRWAEYQKYGRPGYHIGEGRNMVKFSQFIRRYFSDPRNWQRN